MHMHSWDVLVWIVLSSLIFKIRGEVLGDETLTAAMPCPILSDTPISLHFRVFEQLWQDTKGMTGCASLPQRKALGETYKENHIMNIRNERAAYVYLTIDGIHHRTMKSLPHYKEYKCEFALFSNKDVTWLVTMENMPNRESVRFYIQTGSKIISRDNSNLRTVFVDAGVDAENSEELMNWCRTAGVFSRERVASFSEMKVSDVAQIKVTPFLGEDESRNQSEGSHMQCQGLEEDFLSPMVSYQLYEMDTPRVGCELCSPTPTSVPSNGNAYILDLREKHDGVKVINLEIHGKLATKSDAEQKATIILKSNSLTHWNVNTDDSVASSLLLVMEKNDVLNTSSNSPPVEWHTFNLDYDETDASVLINSTEAFYGCKVVSYMQYDSPADLVFLTLSAQRQHTDDSEITHSEAQFIAKRIHDEMEISCDTNALYILIPKAVLHENHLTKDDLKFGEGYCDPIETPDILQYDLTMCGVNLQDGVFKTEFEVFYKSDSQPRGGFFFAPDDSAQPNVNIPLTCTPISDSGALTEAIKHSVFPYCDGETLEIRIPRLYKEFIDSEQLKHCKNMSSNGFIKYYFQRDDGGSCGMVAGGGNCSAKLPVKDDIASLPVEITVRNSLYTPKLSYRLEVYHDYDLKNRVEFPQTVYLPSDDGTDETFHVKVSITSDDPLLTVFLPQCVLGGGTFQLEHLIILSNCPVDDTVRFVRPYHAYQSHEQHFSVRLGSSLINQGGVMIKCDVSACTNTDDFTDQEIPTVPVCWHLHGEGCRSGQPEFYLAPYEEGVVQSGFFYFTAEISKPENVKSISKVPSKQYGMTSWFVTLLLGLAAFLLGCIMVFVIWRIDKNSYKHPQGHRTSSTRCESNSSNASGSGSSQSTTSTKTTGSTSRSMFCLGRSARASQQSTTSKDDSMECKSLMDHCAPLTDNNAEVNMVPVKSGELQQVHNCFARNHSLGTDRDSGRDMEKNDGAKGTTEMDTQTAKPSNEDLCCLPPPQVPHVSTVSCSTRSKPRTLLQTMNLQNETVCESGDCTPLNAVLQHFPLPAKSSPYTFVPPQPSSDCSKQRLTSPSPAEWHLNAGIGPVTKLQFEKLKEVAL